MRREVKLALILAAMSGVVAAIVTYDANRYLPDQEAEAPSPSIPLATVVVAKESVDFGAQLTKFKLGEVQWPVSSVPASAYRSVRELFAEQLDRSALVRINAGEPVLREKITGPGQRASLSALLLGGKKAVSIRVNEVVGVSGFVLPGDRVDILMTRANNKDNSTGSGIAPTSYTDTLLQNVRVLAIDQLADSKVEKPVVVRTVTVEVTLEEAQKLALAASIGELSLVLREEGATVSSIATKRISVADLAGESGDKEPAGALEPTNAVAPAPEEVPPVAKPASVTINIVRGGAWTEYMVKRSASGN